MHSRATHMWHRWDPLPSSPLCLPGEFLDLQYSSFSPTPNGLDVPVPFHPLLASQGSACLDALSLILKPCQHILSKRTPLSLSITFVLPPSHVSYCETPLARASFTQEDMVPLVHCLVPTVNHHGMEKGVGDEWMEEWKEEGMDGGRRGGMPRTWRQYHPSS